MRTPLRCYLFRLGRGPGRLRYLPALCLAGALLALFAGAVNASLYPALEAAALSDARSRISLAIHEAVADCVAEHGLTYSDFITMERDASGNIIALTNNLASASLLRSQLVQAISRRISGFSDHAYKLPLGTLTGWLIFSGRGPGVSIRVLSAGSVTVDVSHNFEAAGINQTLHQVFLDVSASVQLLIPGQTLDAAVDSRICVAETVLVGRVPDTYLQMGGD